MAEIQTARDAFLRLVRAQLKRPQLSFDEALLEPLGKTLYEMVLKDVETPLSAPPPPEKAPLASLTHSRAAIYAAIEDTYDLKDLSPDEPEREALIAASDVVMVGGLRRLRLKDEGRVQLLAAVRETELYRRMLANAVEKDEAEHDAVGKDPVRLPSAWMRCFLSGRFGDLETAPPHELAAALAARERLRLVLNLPQGVPSIPDLERGVALADLLDPLRLLIGWTGGWDGTPRRDRFVGRQRELSALRAFVDEMSSQSIGETLSRFRSSARNVVLRTEKPNLRVLQADGGLGKSALLAKFLLDHALNQSRPFPFAYLDFDRASLNAEQPHQLLIEIARQVGLQFPKAQPELNELADEIRQTRVARSTSKGPATIRDPYAKFVEILREHATFGDRAFLLVLDTLEVVQWNPEAMSRLSGMLQEFRSKRLVELRVVASGRADVPVLRTAAGVFDSADNLQLGALSVDEATQMAKLLGEEAIKEAWKESWSKAIAGAGGWLDTVKRAVGVSDTVRREPLTIRIAVDLVLQAKSEQRQQVVDEIASMKDEGKMLAGRLYERRILNHVVDENAKKLAWPGLVLRRVTLEIARDLLAPFCNLAPEDVDAAFDALAKEVWMVVREGDSLKHLPNLRARTLPLMRANDQKKFDETARAAVDYFGARRTRSRDDRAEWVYHRLQLGASIQELTPELGPEILQALAGADEDFAVESEAASYIASRTATSRLPDPRVFKLSADDALYHLSMTSVSAFGLDDVGIDAVVLDLSKRIDRMPYDLHPWASALWIKTGRWHLIQQPGPVTKAPAAVPGINLFWAARISPPLAFVGAAREDIGIHVFEIVQALAMTRLGEYSMFAGLDRQAARMIRDMKPNPLPSIQAALRTAIVFGDTCRAPALEAWLAARRRGTHDRVQTPTIATSELRALADSQPEAQYLLRKLAETNGGPPARLQDDATVTTASRLLDQFLSTPLAGPEGESQGRKLARVFACRDEDWIVPFGYAAESAMSGSYSPVLRERLDKYSRMLPGVDTTLMPRWADMLQAMRIADEAGDLVGFARAVLESAGADSLDAQPLKTLLEYRDQWSHAIARFLGDGVHTEAKSGEPVLDDEPPPPGPIQYKDDLQRSRWGGLSERDGRSVRGVLDSVESDDFYFSVIVESTDGSHLTGPVFFHLHDTYSPNKVGVTRIIDGRRAELHERNSYGIFAIGIQVKDRNGLWTALELDLGKLPGLPKRFLAR